MPAVARRRSRSALRRWASVLSGRLPTTPLGFGSSGGSAPPVPFSALFASNGSEVIIEGTPSDDTQDGVACKRDFGVNAGLFYEFYGTKCEHLVWNQSPGWAAADGNTPNAINQTGTIGFQTVADGVAEGWHLAHVWGNDFFSTKIGYDVDCIRITGTNPRIRRPQGLFDLRGTAYRADYSGLRFDGGQLIDGYNNWTLLPYNGFDYNKSAVGARLRFTVIPDGTNNPLKVYIGGWRSDAAWYRVAVDGFEDGTYGSMAAAVRYDAYAAEPFWQRILTIPTPGSTPRAIDAWLWENAGSRQFKVHQVVVTNGTIDSTPPTALPVLGVLGDSISETDYAGTVNGFGWVHRLSMQDGYEPANFSLFGYWLTQLVDSGYPGSTDRLAGIVTKNPGKIVVAIGVNDRLNGRTDAQYQADATTLFNYLIANTTGHIYMPLFYNQRSDTGGLANTDRATWYAALQAARAACTTPARVTVWDTTGVLSDDVNDWIPDGLHPTASGQAKIAADIRAHLVTISPPQNLREASPSLAPGDTIHIEWDPPAIGTAVDYHVWVQDHGDPQGFTEFSHAPSSLTTIDVTGLSAGSSYDVYVIAEDGDGNLSDPSDTVVFFTWNPA